MRHLNRQKAGVAGGKHLLLALLGVAALVTAGCGGERDADDGKLINAIILPTDAVLDLFCEDVGINDEPCVLDDPQNPFAKVAIVEFDEDNPEAFNKLELFNSIPPGPDGAKARFYLFATALARRQSGENQFGVAISLHELWNLNGDEIIREQALRAYRSVLDNFFGSVIFFACCADLRPNVDDRGEPIVFPVALNEIVADNLYRTEATGFRRLVDGDPLLVLELLGEWGYTYKPATPPNFDDGVISVNE